MKHTRLFLFAGYDRNGIVDDALVLYVQQLNKFGDIVFCMDCDTKKSEIKKIEKFCIHTMAARHGEYDFGSYKRAYIYARDNKLLEKYDYIYLVNDSVFGPTLDMTNVFNKMESSNTDACGMVISKHKTHEFMESWFIRLNKKIFTSAWFAKFISSVTKLSDKTSVTIQYEHGLTNLIIEHNCTISGVYTIYGRYTYNNTTRLFLRECPIIKKASFSRHNGAIGGQIKYILRHTDDTTHNAIMNSANRLYGMEYMKKFLTSNPFKILVRNIKYAAHKIKDGEI